MVRLALAALGVACAAALPADAQVLYKWVDAAGKVQYSDRPPKDFKGPVTRIEPEYDRSPVVPPAPKPAALPVEVRKGATDAAAPDLVTRRRATRNQLEARLSAARDKLEAAQKGLAEASPELDERQVIQQRMAVSATRGMAPRSNCSMEVGKDGAKIVMCPTMVASSAFYERLAQLEAAVAAAEEELAAAESAWRRGVD